MGKAFSCLLQDADGTLVLIIRTISIAGYPIKARRVMISQIISNIEREWGLGPDAISSAILAFLSVPSINDEEEL